MRTAICPGSFDPVTNGHIDVIERASKLFDEVYVVAMTNYRKVGSMTFTEEERVELLKKSTNHLSNVKVDTFSGLLADYATAHDIHIIVKGLRAVSDFENEFQQSIANRHINEDLETVFLPCSADNMYLSSSFVKQLGQLGGDISDFDHKKIKEGITIMAQIEDYLDEIEELLESGRGSAFSGKTSVDADAIKTVIEDMRLDIPEEIKQAKILATERREIINRANQEADRIVEDAKSRSREYLTAAEMRVKELTEKASKSSEKELKDAHAGAQKILEEARAQADGLIARENIVKEAKTTAETLNAEAEKYLSEAKAGAAKLTADTEESTTTLVAETQAKVDAMLAEAKAQADAMVAEANEKAAAIGAEAQRNAERTIQDADYTAQTKMEAANKWAVDLKASVGSYITNLVNETEYRVAKSLNEVHQLQANINQSSLENGNQRNVRSNQNAVTAAQQKNKR